LSPRLALAAVVAALTLGACEPDPGFALRSSPSGELWIDEPLRLVFDGAVDPLAVTERSVRVATTAGEELLRRVRVDGPALEISLHVDAGLLERAPSAVVIHLAGAPSLHGLTSRDGRHLARPLALTVPLSQGMAPTARGAPRLVSVNGVPLGDPMPPRHAGAIELLFEGRIDLATLRPETCPLLPVAGDVALDPLAPGVTWWLEGERFAVRLELPPGTGLLELRTRMLGLRGPDGAPCEPRAVVQVAPAED
jgi:hypothetical protein